MMQRIEEMTEVLTYAGVEPSYLGRKRDYRFDRDIRFEALGVPYWIEWWANRSYLSIGARFTSHIPFVWVSADTFWPAYRTGLRFRMESGEAFFVATERLPWQEEHLKANP